MQVNKHLRTITRLTPLWLAACIAVVFVLAPTRAEAIPAFGRQFNVKCSTCHAPVPPRLNNLGIIFKRMGYRLPDANDQGQLELKDKPSQSVFDDFSLIGDFRLENSRGKPTALSLHEVEVMGAGVAGKHLSYTAEVAWEDGEIGLELLEGQILAGRPERNFTARFGMIAPLAWEKWNHQRLTIARPLLSDVRVPAGAFRGYRLRDMQEGVELGVNFNRLGDGGAVRSTFLSVGVYNGFSAEGGSMEDNDFKDVMLQALHLWGESNTVGGMWYSGKVTNIGDDAFDDRFNRWSVFGNHRFGAGTDFLAGFGGGRDDTPASAVGRISSRGWFVELTQAIGTNASAVVRYDGYERNRDVSARDQRGPTIALVSQPLDNLLLTAQYRAIRSGTATRGRDFTVKAVVVY